MSGGSYDYAYVKLEELASEVEAEANRRLLPKRIAFARLLRLCAKAMHDIEWVDSGDYGKGDEDKAIREAFALCDKDGASGSQLKRLTDSIALEKIRGLLG